MMCLASWTLQVGWERSLPFLRNDTLAYEGDSIIIDWPNVQFPTTNWSLMISEVFH